MWERLLFGWSIRCFSLSLISLTLVSCASLSGGANSTRPQWINNPGNGVSASAGTNVNGKHAQEELAIARARQEFARRYGVRVVSDQNMAMNVVNNRSSVTANQTASESLDVDNVRAQVKSKWYDDTNDTLWVWLVPAQ